MKKKLFNKKNIFLFFFILLLFLFNQYLFSKKYKNIEFVVEHHMTKKLTNVKHKLYSINNFNVIFSDGQTSVVQINGLSKRSPHASTTYEIFLQKNKNHSWKVKRLYKIK
ncbi:hypothetical protein K144313037_03480 [Clostridium tetani]|uniref:DUF4829 domain-containing protein n=2 Tax=Clostridium tetani TaxID=1513 RepID=A0A4Q0VBS0_CLOTA|nr:hypothetical protein [Clostridium tetani]AVP55348.1 hypothetical protein C3B72_09420 [Clostridium tetani]RXI45734.1 hypothetical protein DP130_11820 [Clostridium tetani]RXI62609.1 hypothetical protein DP123_10895 [Clostridium tetani]RXI77316.1 hypothetical protein DP128_03995 [Clostridium tetani]WFN62357.1 hypothetical protein PAA20_02600 [Clostridium tetani]